MNSHDVIQLNPILSFLGQRYAMQFKKNGIEHYSSCPFHTDGKRPNFRVNEGKNTWYCDVCNEGGTIINFVMKKERLEFPDAMNHIAADGHVSEGPTEVAWYDYLDENGNQLYQVVRYYPKTFKQRHKNSTGGWVWSMDGVRRVLYRLPKVIKSPSVILCEGEKDVDNLEKLGLVATCNVGGANKWLDSYSDCLKGKEVLVWPDQDEPGRKHADLVIKSLTGKAKKLYRLECPDKDASDLITRLGDKALDEIQSLIEKLKPLELALDVPIYTIEELEPRYREFVTRIEHCSVSLFKLSPTLGNLIRPLVPGEIMTIIADTGVGKTAILQNMAYAIFPIKTLLFELELPSTLLFERFLQITNDITGDDVFRVFKSGENRNWKNFHRLSHVYVCDQSRMNMAEMERIINQAELKIGERPKAVMVDYAQLMQGRGKSRYERMSDVAESLKIIAKSTEVVIILATQLTRGERVDGSDLVSLHDAKDSGSIENSSGVVLGAWRDGDEGKIMRIKILKNTKGKSGKVIDFSFGESLILREIDETYVRQDTNINKRR